MNTHKLAGIALVAIFSVVASGCDPIEASVDSVNAGTSWTDGGFDGGGNHIYTQMVGASLATLVVDPDVAVNPDILM